MSEDAAAAGSGPTGESLSCVTCRSRKLRCDRVKPVCTRCAKLSGACVYPESRRKPAFKRRNVKELEERLAQVEGLLRRAVEGSSAVSDVGVAAGTEELAADAINFDAFETPTTEDVLFQGIDYGTPQAFVDDASFNVSGAGLAAFAGSTSAQPPDDFDPSTISGELIGLGGVYEAPPPFELMEELNRLFFGRQQQFAPVVHPGRYYQAFYSPPHMKPPMCLQYAIWALTSNNDPKYHAYHDIFYRRARQYADIDEMKGHGEHFITVAHAQTWCILATDEARSMMFTRAAMSCARAVRLVAMMGLHHLDSPPNEAAFQSGEPMNTCSIHDVFKGGHSYSSFSGSIVVCHLFNLILKHAHRPKQNDNPEDYEYGDYWKRHRDIDNTLSSAFMFLPDSFRLPENYRDLTAINTNLNLHASIICLHHAALERIDTYSLPDSIKRISHDRLSAAAQEIVNIMKLTSHVSANPKTPLAAVSLFCTASVYMYFCKDNHTPTNVDNLDFILAAMEAIGRTHSLTRSFLRQALLDIELNGVQDIVRLPRVTRLSQNLQHGVTHNVPLLARTRFSRHSEAQPPIPGLVDKIVPHTVSLSSTSWPQPITNPEQFGVGNSNDNEIRDRTHKRQRTMLHNVPIRSEPSPSPGRHSRNQNTKPLKPSQDILHHGPNPIGVTVASGPMGKSSAELYHSAGYKVS
ncbi:hypothetical protein F4808DRAFT_464600 [Astrocystis sublimbata]|nr:hypothetical protein F4808DRAFT_464600 [Astrocystis sublimbata]